MFAKNRNLLILSFSLIVVMLGFGMVIPIFPFYIDQTGRRRQRVGPARRHGGADGVDLWAGMGQCLRSDGAQTDLDDRRIGLWAVAVVLRPRH